jgi:proteic killer suppression protein
MAMIKSFKTKETAAVFSGECPKGFPANIVKTARRKLEMVNAAIRLEDLKAPPGNRLEPLQRDRKGQHAIRINAQYRVCFIWTINGPTDVEIVDYHD